MAMFNHTTCFGMNYINLRIKDNNWKLIIDSRRADNENGKLYIFQSDNINDLNNIDNYTQLIPFSNNYDESCNDLFNILFYRVKDLITKGLDEIKKQNSAEQLTILDLLRKLERMPLDTVVYIGDRQCRNVRQEDNKVYLF